MAKGAGLTDRLAACNAIVCRRHFSDKESEQLWIFLSGCVALSQPSPYRKCTGPGSGSELKKKKSRQFRQSCASSSRRGKISKVNMGKAGKKKPNADFTVR